MALLAVPFCDMLRVSCQVIIADGRRGIDKALQRHGRILLWIAAETGPHNFRAKRLDCSRAFVTPRSRKEQIGTQQNWLAYQLQSPASLKHRIPLRRRSENMAFSFDWKSTCPLEAGPRYMSGRVDPG
jgi:hypothetical protein